MSATINGREPERRTATQKSFPWYCIRTRSNFERIVAAALQNRGYEPFLPVYHSVRQWSDRVVESTAPLFPGYLFCRFDASQRTPILSAPGVVSLIGFGEPAAVPDAEIDAVRVLVESGLPLLPLAYLREGERVRINGGALEGLAGTLIKIKGSSRFVVSISLLQRSVTVEIDPTFISAEGRRSQLSVQS